MKVSGGVDIGAGFKQQPDCRRIVSKRRGIQRGYVPRIHHIHLRAFGEQEPHNLGGRVGECRDDQRGPAAFGGRVHLCAMIQQQADLGRIRYRPHQRRGAECILRVDIRSAIDQQAHSVHGADLGGIHQRSDFTIVGDVWASLLIEQGLQLRKIVFTDGGVEFLRVLGHRQPTAIIVSRHAFRMPELYPTPPRLDTRKATERFERKAVASPLLIRPLFSVAFYGLTWLRLPDTITKWTACLFDPSGDPHLADCVVQRRCCRWPVSYSSRRPPLVLRPLRPAPLRPASRAGPSGTVCTRRLKPPVA